MSQQFDTPLDFGDGTTGQPTATVIARLNSQGLEPEIVEQSTESIDLTSLNENIAQVRLEVNNATDPSRLQAIWKSDLSQGVFLLASKSCNSLEQINTFFMSASKLCGVQKFKDCYKDVLKHITSEINSLRMQNPIIDDEKLYSIPSDVVKEARRSVFAFTQASWRRITIKQCLNELSVKSESSLCEELEALSESLYAEKQIEDFIKQAELAKKNKGKKAALGKWKSIWKELEKKFAEMPSETNDDTYFCDESKQWKDKTLEKFKGEMEVSFKKMKIIKIDHSSLQEHVQKLKDRINADNRTLRHLSWLFRREEDATSEEVSRISKDCFELIVEYINNFNWTEIDKKERIELFLDNLVDEVLKREQYLFPQELDELHEQIILFAESCFVRINIEQSTTELWKIINKLHSKHFPSDTADEYKERFKKLTTILDALKFTDPGLRDLCNQNFFRSAKDTVNSFVDQFVRIIQNSFQRSATDSRNSFVDPLVRDIHNTCASAENDAVITSDTIVPSKFRDLSKYDLELVLVEKVLPVAKNCLYVVRIQNSLENFLETPERTFETELKKFNEDITGKVYDDETRKTVFCSKLQSNLSAHVKLQTEVRAVWKRFEERIEKLLDSASRASYASGLLKQKLNNEIKLLFQRTVADLAIFETTENMKEQTQSVLKSFIEKNVEAMPCLFRELQTKLEVSEDDLILWHEEVEFVKSLNNIRNFDKHDRQEYWQRFLEKLDSKFAVEFGTQHNKVSGETTVQESTSDANELEVLLPPVYIFLGQDFRDKFKDLREEWGKKFALKKLEVAKLLKACDKLSKEIERSYPDKQLLLDLFSENENFSLIMEIMCDGEAANKDKQFLINSIKKICDLEDKYEAKALLRNYWIRIKEKIEEFIKSQLPKGTSIQNYWNFKMSVFDYESLQKSMFDMVEEELLNQSCASEFNFTKCNPWSYICQKPSIRHSRFVRSKHFRKWAQPITVIFVIAISLVYLGWSNVSNFITSFKEHPKIHQVILVFIILLPLLLFCSKIFKYCARPVIVVFVLALVLSFICLEWSSLYNLLKRPGDYPKVHLVLSVIPLLLLIIFFCLKKKDD